MAKSLHVTPGHDKHTTANFQYTFYVIIEGRSCYSVQVLEFACPITSSLPIQAFCIREQGSYQTFEEFDPDFATLLRPQKHLRFGTLPCRVQGCNP